MAPKRRRWLRLHVDALLMKRWPSQKHHKCDVRQSATPSLIMKIFRLRIIRNFLSFSCGAKSAARVCWCEGRKKKIFLSATGISALKFSFPTSQKKTKNLLRKRFFPLALELMTASENYASRCDDVESSQAISWSLVLCAVAFFFFAPGIIIRQRQTQKAQFQLALVCLLRVNEILIKQYSNATDTLASHNWTPANFFF